MPSTKKPPQKGTEYLGQTRAPRPDLGAIVDPKALPRTELTKRAYNHEHKHQGAQDRRRNCTDDKLRAVLDGQDSVTMFELTKFVSRQLA